MSKFTDIRDWIDSQEKRVDGWLEKLMCGTHTARIATATILVLLLVGLYLWLL